MREKKVKSVQVMVEWDNGESQVIAYAPPIYKDISVDVAEETGYKKGTRVDGIRRVEETVATGHEWMTIKISVTHAENRKRYDDWDLRVEKKKEY